MFTCKLAGILIRRLPLHVQIFRLSNKVMSFLSALETRARTFNCLFTALILLS
jgi:hypothetical protein